MANKPGEEVASEFNNEVWLRAFEPQRAATVDGRLLPHLDQRALNLLDLNNHQDNGIDAEPTPSRSPIGRRLIGLIARNDAEGVRSSDLMALEPNSIKPQLARRL